MIRYDKTRDPRDCCGCNGCGIICHTDAIKFHDDGEGFNYPNIVQELCTDCGVCEKVCPIEIPVPKKKLSDAFSQKVFAVLHNDPSVVRRSSSGGVFSAIAKDVLDRGGHVFGAEYKEDWSVRHVRISSWDQIDRIRVSKYVQSEIGETYLEARKLLREGQLVYFTGVPCQIAGLRRYLMKDYANLITSDILCHGIPSPKVWQRYLDFLKRPLFGVRMRSINGWGEVMVYSKRPDAKRKKALHWMVSPYLYAFMQNLLHRPVCYTCPFANPSREGDITLGDYWGVQRHHPEIPHKQGVSLVLVNSVKGDEIFTRISGEMRVVPSRIEWAAEENHPLHGPSDPSPLREQFFQDLDRLPFDQLIPKYMRPKGYWSFLAKVTVKEHVKNLLGFFGMERFRT